jgi:hypothetical protein
MTPNIWRANDYLGMGGNPKVRGYEIGPPRNTALAAATLGDMSLPQLAVV